MRSRRRLHYMGFVPGQSLLGHPIDVVFIGSCTNGRLADLRDAARILKGRKVNPKVRTVIVPGSRPVMAAARSEGLDEIFRAAGAEWREPGCSMCIAMNGDELAAGQYCVSTSNRNFEGRQGKGGRTMLASPHDRRRFSSGRRRGRCEDVDEIACRRTATFPSADPPGRGELYSED